MTLKEAAEKCGVTMATMEIVASGSPTLPCLAIQIGKGLGLTREEVKPLGKPLQSDRWGKEGLPKPLEIDVNPHWYKALPDKRGGATADDVTTKDAPGYYVNILAVMERLLVLNKETRDLRCLPKGNGLWHINHSRLVDTRKRYLLEIAEEIGVDVEQITTMVKPDQYYYFRFKLDYEAIARLMERPGNDLENMAARLLPNRRLKDAVYVAKGRIAETKPLDLGTAGKLAKALGVELEEIGHRVIVTF
jgi:hypothetical protein